MECYEEKKFSLYKIKVANFGTYLSDTLSYMWHDIKDSYCTLFEMKNIGNNLCIPQQRTG